MIGRVIPYHLDTFLLTSGRLIGMFIVSNSTLTYQEVNMSRRCHPTDLVYSLRCVEFVTNNLTATLNWKTTITSTSIYHQANLNDSGGAISGSGNDIRGDGVHFRAINGNLPVMAFALPVDLGNITQSENPLVFAIGLFIDIAIFYVPGSSRGLMPPVKQISLWRRRWGNTWDALVRSQLCILWSVRTHAERCFE